MDRLVTILSPTKEASSFVGVKFARHFCNAVRTVTSLIRGLSFVGRCVHFVTVIISFFLCSIFLFPYLICISTNSLQESSTISLLHAHSIRDIDYVNKIISVYLLPPPHLHQMSRRRSSSTSAPPQPVSPSRRLVHRCRLRLLLLMIVQENGERRGLGRWWGGDGWEGRDVVVVSRHDSVVTFLHRPMTLRGSRRCTG